METNPIKQFHGGIIYRLNLQGDGQVHHHVRRHDTVQDAGRHQREARPDRGPHELNDGNSRRAAAAACTCSMYPHFENLLLRTGGFAHDFR